MTPAEAQMLLGIAASFDNRKPSEEAATAWSVALEGLRFVDCRDAIVEHYKKSSEWLMPKQVISEVKRIRSKRIAEAGDLTPPASLNPVETNQWLADARRVIGDGGEVPDARPLVLASARDVVAELGHAGQSLNAELGLKGSREAHAEARRVLEEAAAERKRQDDERRAQLQRMAAAEKDARQKARDTTEAREGDEKPEEGEA